MRRRVGKNNFINQKGFKTSLLSKISYANSCLGVKIHFDSNPLRETRKSSNFIPHSHSCTSTSFIEYIYTHLIIIIHYYKFRPK